MTKEKEIYRCNVCDNIIEVLQSGEGELVCCKVPMELLESRETNLGPQKHIPIIEKTDEGIKVTVGSDEHPMEDEHCVVWLELITDEGVFRHTFQPGERAQAEFPVDPEKVQNMYARMYCNVHGLWES